MTTGERLLLFASGIVMAMAFRGCGQNAPTALNVPGAPIASAQTLASDLPARVKALEELIPDQRTDPGGLCGSIGMVREADTTSGIERPDFTRPRPW